MPIDSGGPALPRRQRVAAYAVVVRDQQVLLSRLAPSVSNTEQWTLPGGGIDFGEHPADAVVREVHEETGLDCALGDPIWIGSIRRTVERDLAEPTDMHSVRIVYAATVPVDAPEPQVVEVDGSTCDARWQPLAEVLAGGVPTVPMVREALAHHSTVRRQRLAAKALVVRDGRVLLARNAPSAAEPGVWTLPGGGVEHGENPGAAVVREVHEETGLAAEVGALLGVHDEHFTGTAPTGLEEDYHGVHLVFAASVGPGVPTVLEEGGTADAADWFHLEDVVSGVVPVSEVVTAALAMTGRR